METPHPELMEFYGTDIYFLEKSGALSLGQLTALQVAAPAAFMAVASSDKAHREKLLAEAEAMNQAFRWVEKRRMAAVSAGFKGASALSPELTKVAEGIGRRLAQDTEAELNRIMEKHASGAELTEFEKEALIGGLLKGFGKMLGGAGKAIGGTGGLKVGRGGMMQGIGGKLRSLGAGARKSGLMQQSIKAAPAAAAAKKGKGLLSFGTKAKLLGTGALALGGYGAYKGMQAGRDYMMTPTSQERMGRYGAAPAHNVNQYGYVVPQM